MPAVCTDYEYGVIMVLWVTDLDGDILAQKIKYKKNLFDYEQIL
jgi:hypothetical protein